MASIATLIAVRALASPRRRKPEIHHDAERDRAA
jgi:hypothetical protein